MCYALPGPRCSNHCFNDLSKARTAFLDAADRIKTDPHTREKFDAAKARFERAQARFDRSPEGQRLLREEAESIRATDPERAAALEALADKGEQVHAKEVGASKKAALAEERAFLDLQRKSHEAWEEARKVSEQVSEQATPEERARLDELDGRVHAFLNQSFTTPLGLKMIKDDLRLARQEYAAATTEEDRARAEKAVRFHAVHLAESKKKRAHMLAEYSAKENARKQADALMAEARATGGLKVLGEKKPDPAPNLTMTPAEEMLSRQLLNPDSKSARRLNLDHADASPALLHSLRDHENPSVRSQVINHPNTSKATLTHMLDRTRSGSEATAIVQRGVLTAEDEHRIVSNPDEPDSYAAYGVAAAGRNPEALRIVSEEYGKRVTYNPHAPGSLLKDLVHESPINVAQHPNATKETLQSIASNADYAVGARKHALARLRGVSYDEVDDID